MFRLPGAFNRQVSWILHLKAGNRLFWKEGTDF
jgi:hypothetical protein